MSEIQINCDVVMKNDEGLIKWLELLHYYGIAIIKNAPTEKKSALKILNKMTKVVEDIKANGPEVYKPTCACEYVNMSLTKAASTTFANNAANKPILDFIKNYTLPTAVVNKSLAFYMDESDGDMVETAKNFLSNNNMWGEVDTRRRSKKKLKHRFNF